MLCGSSSDRAGRIAPDLTRLGPLDHAVSGGQSLWMSIRSLELSPKVQQLQFPRSGPRGQPVERSQREHPRRLALAHVVGARVEVPVMRSLIAIASRTRPWFCESGACGRRRAAEVTSARFCEHKPAVSRLTVVPTLGYYSSTIELEVCDGVGER